MKKLDIVLQIMERIPWALLYVVAISIVLLQYRLRSHEILHLWCFLIFFSYRALSTLPISLHSFMRVRDVVLSAVQRAWSKARDFFMFRTGA
jgi:hypothetical protein